MAPHRTSGPWNFFGPDKPERVVIATTDPVTLPDLSTFYLITNLPTPGSSRAQESEFAAASVEEVVRLYGLRMWVEESRHPGEACPGVVRVSSQERSGDQAALAAGVLCLFFLLVSSGSSSCGRAADRASSTPFHDSAGTTRDFRKAKN
jgi:hypothetical protein